MNLNFVVGFSVLFLLTKFWSELTHMEKCSCVLIHTLLFFLLIQFEVDAAIQCVPSDIIYFPSINLLNIFFAYTLIKQVRRECCV